MTQNPKLKTQNPKPLPPVAPEGISSARAKSFDRSNRPFSLLKKGGVNVFEPAQLLSRNFLTEKSFDVQHCFQLFGDHQSESISHLFGPSGTPNPMDVVFRMERDIIIDHMRDARDIKPASSYIRCYQHFVFTGLESV